MGQVAPVVVRPGGEEPLRSGRHGDLSRGHAVLEGKVRNDGHGDSRSGYLERHHRELVVQTGAGLEGEGDGWTGLAGGLRRLVAAGAQGEREAENHEARGSESDAGHRSLLVEGEV